MARSRGVTIYGTYAVIVGGLNVAMNGGALALREKAGESLLPQGWTVAALGVGLLLCAAGIGAFLLKPWGRALAMAAAVTNLALLFVDLRALPQITPAVQGPFLAGRAIHAAVNLGILWFFTRPPVAAQFQRA